MSTFLEGSSCAVLLLPNAEQPTIWYITCNSAELAKLDGTICLKLSRDVQLISAWGSWLLILMPSGQKWLSLIDSSSSKGYPMCPLSATVDVRNVYHACGTSIRLLSILNISLCTSFFESVPLKLYVLYDVWLWNCTYYSKLHICASLAQPNHLSMV